MKWSKCVFIALTVLLTGMGLAAAQDDIPQLAPNIESVVSAGPWSADGSGWYRAIIRTGGFEHVVSDLTLQWMQEPSGNLVQRRDAANVVVKSVIIRPCIGRLDDPRFQRRGKSWRLTVRCMDTHVAKAKPVDIVIALGAPGMYSMETGK
jgi:hypothetical protein